MLHISSMGVLVNLLKVSLYCLTGSAALADSVSFCSDGIFTENLGQGSLLLVESDPSTHHGHKMFVMLPLQKYNSFRDDKR